MKLIYKQPLNVSFLVSIILGILLLTVYFFYSKNRELSFFELLEERMLTRKAYILENPDQNINNLINHANSNLIHILKEEYGIYDIYGNPIVKSKFAPKIINKTLLHNLLKQNSDDINIKIKKDHSQVIYLKFYDEIENKNYVLFNEAKDEEGLEKQNYLAKILLGSYFTALIVIFLIVRALVYRDLKPLDVIANRMKKISSANLNQRLPEAESKDEIGLMAQTFNEMIDRLDFSYAQQKNFVSYVSHELRTPLAIMQGQTEVTLMREREPKEYQQAMQGIKDEVKGMIKLVNDLLLLARANSDGESLEYIQCQLDEIIWQSRKMLLEKNKEYEIKVNFDEDISVADDMIIKKGNFEMLKIMISNLIENACKYSENKKAEVYMSFQKNHITFTVTDKGKGIPESELKHIFQPFYRSSHTKTIDGHGLGLPLVKRIVELHKGRISIKSTEGMGTTVEVVLPKNKSQESLIT